MFVGRTELGKERGNYTVLSPQTFSRSCKQTGGEIARRGLNKIGWNRLHRGGAVFGLPEELFHRFCFWKLLSTAGQAHTDPAMSFRNVKNMKNITVLPTAGTANDPEWVGKAAYQNLVAALNNGARVLQGLWAERLQIEHLKADGFDPGQANAMKATARVFFGPTRQRKLQKKNQQLAIEKQYCVAALTGIVAELWHLRKETDNPAHQPQSVLNEILKKATGWVSDIRQQAVHIVRAHNRAIEEEHEKARRKAAAERERFLQKEREQQPAAGPDGAETGEPGSSEPDETSGTLTVEEPTGTPDVVQPPSVPEPLQTPHGEVIFTSRTNAAGLRTVIVHAPEAVLAEFEIQIDKQARSLMRENPELTLQQARYLVLEQLHKQSAQNVDTSRAQADADRSNEDDPNSEGQCVDSEKTAGLAQSGASKNSEMSPESEAFVFHGADYKELKKDDPSPEVLAKSFGSTRGTIRTGAELKKQGLGRRRTFIHLDWENYTGIIHTTRPELAQGTSDSALEKTLTRIRAPLDLGTKVRAPNQWIRKIVDALFLQCVWPGCPKSAILSQYHHMVAAKNGGSTSVWNLTKLCAHHNGRNDDDRERPVNGFVFMADGVIKFQPTDQSAPITKTDPLTQLSGLTLSRSQDLPCLAEILDAPVPGHGDVGHKIAGPDGGADEILTGPDSG